MQVKLQKGLMTLKQATCPRVPEAICSDHSSCYVNKVCVFKTETVPLISKIMTSSEILFWGHK